MAKGDTKTAGKDPRFLHGTAEELADRGTGHGTPNTRSSFKQREVPGGGNLVARKPTSKRNGRAV